MKPLLKKQQELDLPLSKIELRLVQARLMAIMSGIDGKVMNVENLMADSMLELLDQEESYKLKELYAEELLKPQTDESVNEVMDFMQRASVSDRVSLMQMLSSLASCDGELHKNEEAFLKASMRKLEVIVQITNPSVINN